MIEKEASFKIRMKSPYSLVMGVGSNPSNMIPSD